MRVASLNACCCTNGFPSVSSLVSSSAIHQAVLQVWRFFHGNWKRERQQSEGNQWNQWYGKHSKQCTLFHLKKRLGTPCLNLLIFTHFLLFSEVCVEFGLRHNFTRMQGEQIREAILKIKSYRRPVVLLFFSFLSFRQCALEVLVHVKVNKLQLPQKTLLLKCLKRLFSSRAFGSAAFGRQTFA